MYKIFGWSSFEKKKVEINKNIYIYTSNNVKTRQIIIITRILAITRINVKKKSLNINKMFFKKPDKAAWLRIAFDGFQF